MQKRCETKKRMSFVVKTARMVIWAGCLFASLQTLALSKFRCYQTPRTCFGYGHSFVNVDVLIVLGAKQFDKATDSNLNIQKQTPLHA